MSEVEALMEINQSIEALSLTLALSFLALVFATLGRK